MIPIQTQTQARVTTKLPAYHNYVTVCEDPFTVSDFAFVFCRAEKKQARQALCREISYSPRVNKYPFGTTGRRRSRRSRKLEDP